MKADNLRLTDKGTAKMYTDGRIKSDGLKGLFADYGLIQILQSVYSLHEIRTLS